MSFDIFGQFVFSAVLRKVIDQLQLFTVAITITFLQESSVTIVVTWRGVLVINFLSTTVIQ